jgi:predicted lipoprotein with Yx(FWY)xxD motif
MKRTLFLTAALAVTALVLAACSNSSTSTPPAAGGTTTSTSSPSGNPMSGATVQVTDNSSFGKILTDAEGNTLYLFEQDQGTKTACTTGCSSTWPALTVSGGKPTAGAGVNASLLGVAKQADGSMQVTYNGHLVYMYSGDSAPGDTNGQGISGVWFVVSSTGDAVQQASGGGSSSSGGYSYH